jgi:hypothetical protein
MLPCFAEVGIAGSILLDATNIFNLYTKFGSLLHLIPDEGSWFFRNRSIRDYT